MNKAGKKTEVAVSDAAYQELNRMTLAGWLDYHQREVVFDKVSWMGIPTWKNVMDLWIYQELLFKVRPDLVIEMGSFKGGSALYLAQILELLGAGEVISVDIDHSRFEARHPRISLLTGSTRDAETVLELKSRAADRKVMIIHDADHARDTVLADLETYADLVSRDSYFIVEDGVVDLFPPDTLLGGALGGPGPLPAIREFLRRDKRFVIDRQCQRYHLTYNPDGYLKKIAE